MNIKKKQKKTKKQKQKNKNKKQKTGVIGVSPRGNRGLP